MIQRRLVNMGDQADVASCVPQALPGRRVGVLRGKMNSEEPWPLTLPASV